MKHSTTGAMASSSRGASCTKPSKGTFRTQSHIQNGTFARVVNGLVFPQKNSILDVWLGSTYASALYPQKSAKMQLLK